MTGIRKRPRAKAHLWYWTDGTTKTPGIGLFSPKSFLAHLTATEARVLADKLHDLCDQLDKENP